LRDQNDWPEKPEWLYGKTRHHGENQDFLPFPEEKLPVNVQVLPEPSVKRELFSLLIKIIVITSIALLAFTFMYGLHYNVDPSMYPAIKDGDLLMYYHWNKDYRAGDLLLLNYQGETQVRRVIATAGDTVDITEAGLMINGALQQERDIFKKTERYAEGIDFPITLGENEVFVLGDAREGVTDSRIYGAVNTKDTLGIVITILRLRNL